MSKVSSLIYTTVHLYECTKIRKISLGQKFESVKFLYWEGGELMQKLSRGVTCFLGTAFAILMFFYFVSCFCLFLFLPSSGAIEGIFGFLSTEVLAERQHFFRQKMAGFSEHQCNLVAVRSQCEYQIPSGLTVVYGRPFLQFYGIVESFVGRSDGIPADVFERKFRFRGSHKA